MFAQLWVTKIGREMTVQLVLWTTGGVFWHGVFEFFAQFRCNPIIYNIVSKMTKISWAICILPRVQIPQAK